MNGSVGRSDPFKAVLLEWKGFQIRGSQSHRVDGGTDVMKISRPDELFCACATPYRGSGFKNFHRLTIRSKPDSGSQAIGPCPYNDRIVIISLPGHTQLSISDKECSKVRKPL